MLLITMGPHCIIFYRAFYLFAEETFKKRVSYLPSLLCMALGLKKEIQTL